MTKPDLKKLCREALNEPDEENLSWYGHEIPKTILAMIERTQKLEKVANAAENQTCDSCVHRGKSISLKNALKELDEK